MSNLNRGHRFTLLTKDWKGLPNSNLIDIHQTTVGPFDLKEQFMLTNEIRNTKPDLFYSPHFIFPLFVGKIPGAVTIHDLTPLYFPNQFSVIARSYVNFFVSRALGSCQGVIAISNNTTNDLRKTFKTKPDVVHTIYNGFDSERFNKRHSDSCLERFRIDKGLPERYFIFVGNQKPHKNLKYSIDVLGKIVAEHASDIRLVIVGPGDGSAIKQLAGSLPGGQSLVYFTGFLTDEELSMAYQASQGLIFPSCYEGFGYPILEAMASGIPVICSDKASLPEVAGDAAFYIDISSIQSGYEAVIALLSDNSLRKSLVDKGLERANSFPWSKTACDYIDLFELLAGGTLG